MSSLAKQESKKKSGNCIAITLSKHPRSHSFDKRANLGRVQKLLMAQVKLLFSGAGHSRTWDRADGANLKRSQIFMAVFVVRSVSNANFMHTPGHPRKVAAHEKHRIYIIFISDAGWLAGALRQ